MEVKPPVETIPTTEPTGAPETLTYKPELNLALDQAEKKPYRRKWIVDAPSITVGAASDGTIFTNTSLIFSDLLGDHRIFVAANTVSSYGALDVTYLNMKRRFQWGGEAFDYRDYYLASVGGQAVRERQASRQTGAFVFGHYPLNRYYRLEGTTGFISSAFTYPYVSLNGLVDFSSVSDNYAIGSVGLSGDTTRYKSFGPYHGKRFELNVLRAQEMSGDSGSITAPTCT